MQASPWGIKQDCKLQMLWSGGRPPRPFGLATPRADSESSLPRCLTWLVANRRITFAHECRRPTLMQESLLICGSRESPFTSRTMWQTSSAAEAVPLHLRLNLKVLSASRLQVTYSTREITSVPLPRQRYQISRMGK